MRTFAELVQKTYGIELRKAGNFYQGGCPRCGSGGSGRPTRFVVFENNVYCYACEFRRSNVGVAIDFLNKNGIEVNWETIRTLLLSYNSPDNSLAACSPSRSPITMDDFPPLPEKSERYINDKGEPRSFIGKDTFIRAYLNKKNREKAYNYWRRFRITKNVADQAWLGSNTIGYIIPYFLYAEEPTLDAKGRKHYQRRIVGGRVRCKEEHEKPDKLKYWSLRRKDGLTLRGIPYDPFGVLGSASGRRPGKEGVTIILTEDEKSALTATSLGLTAGIYGVAMKPSRSWAPHYRNMLGAAERIIIAYDNDPTGAEYTRTMKHYLWDAGFQKISILSIVGVDDDLAAWAASLSSFEEAQRCLLEMLCSIKTPESQ